MIRVAKKLLLLLSLWSGSICLAQNGIQFVYEEVGGQKVQKGIKYDGKIFRSQAELYQYQEAQMFNNKKSRGQSGKRKGSGMSNFERMYMEQVREQEERLRKADMEAQKFSQANQQHLNNVVSTAAYNQHVGTEIMLENANASLDHRRQQIESGGYSTLKPTGRGSGSGTRPSRLDRSRMLQALDNTNNLATQTLPYPQNSLGAKVYDYPKNNNILDIYEKGRGEEAPNETAIYIQRQRAISDKDTTETINLALKIKHPETELIPVEPAEIFLVPQKESFQKEYEADSIEMRKKMRTLIMLNDMVSSLDEEIGINLVDATHDVWKAIGGMTTGLLMGEMDKPKTAKNRALSELSEYSLEYYINEQMDNYFLEMKKRNGLREERSENAAYEVTSQARDIASFAEKAGKIVGVVGQKSMLLTVLMHTPELGRSIGSAAASINIYFQRKKIIEQREELLLEIKALDRRMSENVRMIYSQE